ncbi:methyltransferase family protein [Granulicella sibirica]|uniref:Phospholipid methyltransferase n=1 Tax=Granulicella sibirica TaxID=2479048 RepID=A0A4Q0SYU1_9BACT|nr:isoprenylcysteine carboxylmethyltransferase family protein [Granulicella sibirica]RXH54798.1 hypothetical protein GRAN_3902 [Granulicella sibirica]
MTQADWERAAALYLPISLSLIAGLLSRRHPRQFPASLLSLLWTLPSLLALQVLNQHALWWTFAPGSEATLRTMPLEFYLGWAILWGILPSLALPNLNIPATAAILVVADCLLMPLCRAGIHLNHNWLTGEALAVATVLLPSLSIARWTRRKTHLALRATFQLAVAALLFLFLMPELVFALRPGPGWSPLLNLPSLPRQLALQIICLLALPAVAAVMEFAARGNGTPIPYDPPTSLVSSGIYRFSANPIQISCVLVLFAWAALLRNPWLLIPPVVAIAYSAGLATWDESKDLDERFGAAWRAYRAEVHNWVPRWRPFHAGSPARLYIARTCGPCSQIRNWLEARHPVGLEILDAESLPDHSIHRMRYETGGPQGDSATVDGVRAMAQALEHLNLPWALCGLTLRLPGVWQAIQLLTDASGLGPRSLCSYEEFPGNGVQSSMAGSSPAKAAAETAR